MTTHTDRIRQMAQEAGFSLGSWPDRGTVITADHSIDVTEWIARFAQLVAEDCARVADTTTEQGALDEHGETLAYTTAAAIRARYSLKD